MRRFLFLLVAVFFIYIGIATIFTDFQFVGKVGELIGKFNRKYFGYIAFIYPFALLIPLWHFYTRRTIDVKEGIDKIQAIFLGFFIILFLQALLFKPPHNGALAYMVIQTLAPYIGLAGVWLLVLLLALILYLGAGMHFIHTSMRFCFYKCFRTLNRENEIVTVIRDYFYKFKNMLKELLSKREELRKKDAVEPFFYPEFEDTAFEEMKRSKKHPSIRLIKNESSGKKEDMSQTEIKSLLSKLQKEPVQQMHSTLDVSTNVKGSLQAPKSSMTQQEEKRKKRPHSNKKPQQESKEVKIVKELEENEKLLATIEKGSVEKPTDFLLPSIEFLQKPKFTKSEIDEALLDRKVIELLQKLKQFKIDGDVVRTYSGPLVTTFEFKPAPHVKVSKILNLADDLAMALKAQTIRIQAPIPGKDVVGIEIPNEEFETIYLREIIESDIFKKAASPLTLALGKDIVGKPFVTDLRQLPHLLIAGTTGSGKSVGINAMVISLLYRNAPDKLKLMMIDPKMLEFSIYNDIPHLLTPVITSSKQAVVALSNMVAEMERRYHLMSQMKTKNIEGYNRKARKEGMAELPYIVVVIDELADLMMTSGKEVEYSIARLAQMARASGIHLIVATQRPSVDVVTGLIKANLPARISFRVGQKVDSKVILDTHGAESLLGRGDMLFTPPGINGIIRLHAPWVSEGEIEEIVEFLKAQREPEYDEKFLAESISGGGVLGSSKEELDELYEEAKEIVLSERKTSISYLQRRLQIGYNRAARIVEQLENTGVLSPPNAKGSREILI